MAVKSSFKNMVLCLGVITLVCGALLSGIYVLTEEPIKAAQEAKTVEAISEVLPAFASLAEAVQDGDYEYTIALGESGDTVGVAIKTFSSGFGGRIKMMVGFTPDGVISSTSVLEHSETPGLGAKCVEPAFADQFHGFNPAAKKLQVKQDQGDVDAITAATITSRAYCVALQNAISEFEKVFPAKDAVNEVSDTLSVEITAMEEIRNE